MNGASNDPAARVVGDALSRLGVAGLHLVVAPAPRASGTGVIISWGDTRATLALTWVGQGWPSEVRRALDGAANRRDRDRDVYVARRFSSGSLELLRSRGALYADGAGNMRIVLRSRLALVSHALPAPPTPPPGLTWSRSAVEIAELLLVRAEHEWTVAEMSTAAAWSVPQVSKVFRALQRAGWLARSGPRRGEGVRWIPDQPGALLEAWSDHQSTTAWQSFKGYVRMADPAATAVMSVPRAWPRKRWRWAVGGWAAANHSVPFSTPVPSLLLYVQAPDPSRAAEDLREVLGVRQTSDGANLEVRALPRLLTEPFPHGIEDAKRVTAPRMYADLAREGGRAEDVAQHVRRELLGY